MTDWGSRALHAQKTLRPDPGSWKRFLRDLRTAAGEGDADAMEALGGWLQEGLRNEAGKVVSATMARTFAVTGSLAGADAGTDAGAGVVDPDHEVEWPQGAPPPSPHTIDSIELEGWREERYPDPLLGGMRIAGFHGTYYLSDGSSWPSGAGTADQAFMTLDHLTREGSVIRYHMTTPDLIVRRTDGSFGDHAANYRLETLEDLIIVAQYDSPVGTATAGRRSDLRAPTRADPRTRLDPSR